MNRRPQSRKRKIKQRSNHRKHIVVFMGFIWLIIFMFYLWGRVQIDTMLFEIEGRKEIKSSLEKDVNDLQAQLDAKRRYERIVKEASKLGMITLKGGQLKQLPVDFTGLPDYNTRQYDRLQVAGMNFFISGFDTRKKNKVLRAEE